MNISVKIHVTSEKASGKPFLTITNQPLALLMKRTGTKGASWCLLHSCCGWRKGTSQDEGTSSSEEYPIALSIV